GHAHLLEHIDGLGEVGLGLLSLPLGLQHTGVAQVAAGELGFAANRLLEPNGFQHGPLSWLWIPRVEDEQRLSQGPLRQGLGVLIADFFGHAHGFVTEALHRLDFTERQETRGEITGPPGQPEVRPKLAGKDGRLFKQADTIGNFALDARNPSKTGKSPLVWQACYQAARVAYLTTT